MSRRLTVFLAWIGFGILLVLHLDFWRPQRAVVHLGWLPEELLYRLGWIVLAWLYLVYVCGFVWKREEEAD